MKFHTEMTDEELLALTETQKEDCTKLVLVKEGNPLPYPKPEIPTVANSEIKPCTKVFKAGEWFFEHIEDALAVLEAAKVAIRLDYQWMPGNTPNLKVKPLGDFETISQSQLTVENVDVYDKNDADALSKIFASREKLEQPLKDWQCIEDAYQAAYSQVNEAVWAAQSRKREKETRDAYMQECLRLADKDQVIAQRFFEKRYPTETKTE